MTNPVGYVAKTGHGTFFKENISDELKNISVCGMKVWKPVYTKKFPDLSWHQVNTILDALSGNLDHVLVCEIEALKLIFWDAYAKQ